MVKVADRDRVDPAHSVELLVAVGVPGGETTVTLVVPGKLVQPKTVCVTEYIPVASVVAPTMTGF